MNEVKSTENEALLNDVLLEVDGKNVIDFRLAGTTWCPRFKIQISGDAGFDRGMCLGFEENTGAGMRRAFLDAANILDAYCLGTDADTEGVVPHANIEREEHAAEAEAAIDLLRETIGYLRSPETNNEQLTEVVRENAAIYISAKVIPFDLTEKVCGGTEA